MRHPVSTLCCFGEGLSGAVVGWVVGFSVDPGSPEDADPGSGEDADGHCHGNVGLLRWRG